MDPSLSLTRLISRMLWRCLGAEARGTKLLKENLSPAQLQQYRQYRHFDVIGGQTGKRYCIRLATSLNIDEYSAEGGKVTSWCFAPEGHLANGDVMLAQKLALELFEDDALAIAYRLPPSRGKQGSFRFSSGDHVRVHLDDRLVHCAKPERCRHAGMGLPPAWFK